VDHRAGQVTFKLFSDSGIQQGNTRIVPIQPRGKIHVTDQSFFLNAGDSLTQGYVEITSNVRLTGSVIFGDQARSRFSAALPLVRRLLSDIIYSQLVSNETYFMGIAVLNTGSADLTATIDLFNAGGTPIVSKQEVIPGKQRKSQLLTQYFPSLAGQNISSGYVRVRLTRAAASFALFGTVSRLDVLSAVQAQAAP
jgi:hypothetical protein